MSRADGFGGVLLFWRPAFACASDSRGIRLLAVRSCRAVSLRKGRRIKPLKSGRLKGECRGRGTPRARQVEASDEVISAI